MKWSIKMNCPDWQFIIWQIITTSFFCLFYLIGEGCDSYLINTDLDRSVHNRSLNGFEKCDNALLEGWYRFNSAVGARIPDYCVNRYRCNTHAPGWLNGTQPSLQEGAVNRTVCFHWNSDCCQWSKTIMVRNCGPFFTYSLAPPGYCHLRYCVTDATSQH